MDIIKEYNKNLFPKELKVLGVEEDVIRSASKSSVVQAETEKTEKKEEKKSPETAELKNFYEEKLNQLFSVFKQYVESNDENIKRLAEENKRIAKELFALKNSDSGSSAREEKQTRSKETEKTKEGLSNSDITVEKFFMFRNGRKA